MPDHDEAEHDETDAEAKGEKKPKRRLIVGRGARYVIGGATMNTDPNKAVPGKD